MNVYKSLLLGLVSFVSVGINAASYDVAAYVWPAFHPASRWAELGIFKDGKGEWQNLYEAVKHYPDDYQGVKPLWGYENEADPVVVARKIDAATAAGVNVFIYDWYWYGGRPFLEEALDNGFLKAPNCERMKFYLMYANHNVTKLWNNKVGAEHKDDVVWSAKITDEDWRTIVARWISLYFRRPNYYTIKGCPVLSLYNVAGFVEWEGLEKARSRIAYLRAEVKKAGFPDLHLQGVDKCKVLPPLGFDSVTLYNWGMRTGDKYLWNETGWEGDYCDWGVDAIRAFADVKADAAKIGAVFFPNLTCGWDTNARYPAGNRRPIVHKANPRDFERFARDVKSWADVNLPSDQPKLITVNAWNEWTEGTYLEPDDRFGYGYLNALWRVFVGGSVSGGAVSAFRLADVTIAYEPATALTEQGTNWLKAAVRDLQTAVEKTTGRCPKAFEEAKLPPDVRGPVLFLGDTAAARAAGVADASLRRGDWRIRTVANRACLYARSGMGASSAATDFVERYCDLLYVTPEEDDPFSFDPDRTVPADDRTVRPVFYSGTAYPKIANGNYLRHRRFIVTDEIEGDYRVSLQTKNAKGRSCGCHTSFCYLPPEKHFKDHPEWYSLVGGKRSCRPDGQICMSNPEARKVCLDRLLAYIAADRKDNPSDPPLVYDFTQQDNLRFMCECPACRAICAKYNREPGGWCEGGDAGLQLEFVNWIAERVAKKYPDVWIRTFAYDSTEKPPKPGTIRPAQNVMIWWCDLFGRSDHTRPLGDPDFNVRQLDVLREWRRIAPRVQVWDYMLYGQRPNLDYPEWSPDAIAADAKTFRDLGIDFVFMETEAGELFPQPFHALNNYLVSTFYRDPDADLDACVKRYCRVYGRGATAMERALASLRRDMAAGPCRHASDWPHRNLPWRNRGTMERFRKLVREARDSVPAGTAERTRIVRALASVSRELFRIYGVEGAAAERAAAAKEYESALKEYAKGAPLSEGDRQKLVKKLEDAVAVMDLRFKTLPDELKGVDSSEIRCVDFHSCGNYLDARIRDDPDSETGHGYVWKRGKPDDEHAVRPIPCGVYDTVFKSANNFTIAAERLATDEKYHWLKIGKVYVGPSGYFWMPGDWTMMFRLGDFYRNPEGLKVNPNWYDLYLSLKVTGPAYVPGSKSPNGLWADRIVLHNVKEQSN